MIIFFYLVLGAIAGFTAGLFGIGGGLIIVPVLVYAFTLQGIAPEVLTHMAVATSLATIVVTSISSVLAHHKAKAVQWNIFTVITPGILLGAWLGSQFAAFLSGTTLRILLGLFILLIAAQMGFGFKASAQREVPPASGLSFVGIFIGGISALFGIGGGSLTVPFLSYCNVRIQHSVATAAAVGLPIAVAGAAGSIFAGFNNVYLPEESIGYVYWPAFLGIVATSALMAPVGAKLAHKLPAEQLKKLFALFLVFIGIEFLVQSWGLL
jgi:uncharacterized membrane protein YfcA